jgi:hypothetical protein
MRDIRALTGLREKLVKEQTDHKNRAHKVLDSDYIGYRYILWIYSGNRVCGSSNISCPAVLRKDQGT